MRKIMAVLAACLLLESFWYGECVYADSSGTEQNEAVTLMDGFSGMAWRTPLETAEEKLDCTRRQIAEGEDKLSFLETEQAVQTEGVDQVLQVYAFDEEGLVGGRLSFETDGFTDTEALAEYYESLYGAPAFVKDIGDEYPFFLWIDKNNCFTAMYSSETRAYVYCGISDSQFITYASAFQNWYNMDFIKELERIIHV